MEATPVENHRANATTRAGPPLGLMALAHVGLFVAGVVALNMLSVGALALPTDTAAAAQRYYAQNADAIRVAAFLQFGSAIPLGIFTAAITSRARFLGLNAVGVAIALFGGIAAAVMLALCGLTGWVISQPDVAAEIGAVRVVQLLNFATGGVGTVVPFGVLLAGISVSAGRTNVLPRWIVVLGVVVALLAELSALSMIVPQASLLLPLGRFGGMLWMVAVGVALTASWRAPDVTTP